MLDGLLQSISPFVLADQDVEDFSRAFSQIVSAQLLPQGRLFDADDFLLFQDLEMDCGEIPEAELEDCLLSIKEHVLKGASYRQENFEDAAYELRRFFAQRKDRVTNLVKERDSAEAKLAQSELVHVENLRELERQHARKEQEERAEFGRQLAAQRGQIDALIRADENHKRRKASIMLFAKKCVAGVVIASVILLGAHLANRWGSGKNLFQRLVFSIPVFSVLVGSGLLVVKVVLFPKDSLKDVFKSWQEVRDLFH